MTLPALEQAEDLIEIASQEEDEHDSILAIGYALIAIAGELQRANDREEKEAEMKYSDDLYKAGM